MVEARAAAKRRAVDDAVDAVAQQGMRRCSIVCNVCGARGRDLPLLSWTKHASKFEIWRSPFGPDSHVDEAHVGAPSRRYGPG